VKDPCLSLAARTERGREKREGRGTPSWDSVYMDAFTSLRLNKVDNKGTVPDASPGIRIPAWLTRDMHNNLADLRMLPALCVPAGDVNIYLSVNRDVNKHIPVCEQLPTLLSNRWLTRLGNRNWIFKETVNNFWVLKVGI
jgi:hypothetical protein